MNTLKNLLPALAFVTAIGAVFAFTPANGDSMTTKAAKAQEVTCAISGQVSSECSSLTDGQICKLEAPFQQYNAIPDGTVSDCLNASTWKRPSTP